MRALKLVSTGLEEAVAELLSGLEATVKPGPAREHDLEVTFPGPFVRRISAGLVNIRANKKFVVEVKSSQRKGVKLEDLRQTLDWVGRESRRLVPPEVQAHFMYALESAKLDLEFRLAGDTFERSRAEKDDARTAAEDLIRAVDMALNGISFRVKGLLIINDHIESDRGPRRPLLESNLSVFAKVNQIAVMSWSQLLNTAGRIKDGEIDALDFWSCLFDMDGLFEFGEYDWLSKSNFQGSLFDPSEVEVISDIKFLKREPEAMLSNVWRQWAQNPADQADS